VHQRKGKTPKRGERKRNEKRNEQSIGALVGQLIARRGYAQVAATSQFHDQIVAIIGKEMGAEITVGKLNRGTLKVFANDSVTIQELTFQKRSIIKRIAKEMPDAKVTDIRFGVLTKTP
jgi:hypothetical protein